MTVPVQGLTAVVVHAVLAGGTAAPAVLVLACRAVHTPLSLRPVEVGAVSALIGLTVGLVITGPTQSMALLLPLAVLGFAAAVVDLHEGRLPDVFTGPLLVLVLVLGTATAGGTAAVGVTVVAAFIGGVVALSMKVAVSAGSGWGDAKLVPSLAVVLARHDAVLTGVVTVSVLVAVTAVIVGIGAGRSALVPYGPALVVGTIGAAAL